MSDNPDDDLVASWLDPVGLDDMLAALRGAGFSGDAYRDAFADLSALLPDERAGAMHFLRYGYAEGRVFRHTPAPDGLERLSRLAVGNRAYLDHVRIALALAWGGGAVQSVADLGPAGAMLSRLRGLGGMPLLIVGDASAGLYRRGIRAGSRWTCPLLLSPLDGIEALRRTTPARLVPEALSGPASEAAIPYLWKFGQREATEGWLAHRLRHGIGPGDLDAFTDHAATQVAPYADWLSGAIAPASRPVHWIVGVLPPLAGEVEPTRPDPALQAEFGERLGRLRPDPLGDRIEMHRLFNLRLEQEAERLGFGFAQDLDRMLTPLGDVEERYLAAAPDRHRLDYQATACVLSGTVWTVASSRGTAAATGMRERFTRLLEEIRQVQLDEAG